MRQVKSSISLNHPSATRLAFCLGWFLLGSITLSGCGGNLGQKEKTAPEQETAKPQQNTVTIVILADQVPQPASSQSSGNKPSDPTDSNGDELPPLAIEIQKEFQSLELGQVIFHVTDTDQYLANPLAGDLIIYPPNRFGDLVNAKLLRSIPSYVTKSESYAENDVFLNQRLFSRHRKTPMAISNGTTSLMLLVRTDILEKFEIPTPTNWQQYDRVCRTLVEKKNNGELLTGKIWSPTIEPLDQRWKSVTLLTRSASYVRARGRYSSLFNYTSWLPLIDREPFQKALSELKTTRSRFHPDHCQLDPLAVENAFLRGESVMAITWPHPLDDQAEIDSLPQQRVAIHPIPGSQSNFNFSDNQWEASDADQFQVPFLGTSGQSLSILKTTSQASVAARRIGLLVGKQFSEKLFTADRRNGFPSRASQMGSVSQWMDPRYPISAADQLADNIQAANEATVWMMRPRIAASSRYEKILSQEMEKCFQSQSVAQTLTSVANQWSELNGLMDLDLQKQINLESLGVK